VISPNGMSKEILKLKDRFWEVELLKSNMSKKGKWKIAASLNPKDKMKAKKPKR
jgi:hypothetical protein